MPKPWAGKAIAVVAVLVILFGIVLHFYDQSWRQDATTPAGMTRSAPQRASSAPPLNPFDRVSAPFLEAQTAEQAAVDFDWRRVLRGSNSPPKLPREEVEKFLEQHRRSADSLLAAYHALEDTNYLAEAATRFPNDPKVQWSVLARDVFPEERRKWLDLFKASSPDNSLANYLSAENHFNSHYQERTDDYRFGANNLSAKDYLTSGHAGTAINELLEATRKPLFKDYTMESRLDEEELNLAAGRSPLQSRLSSSGWAADLLPELATFKSIAIDLLELQKQYLSAGDTTSAEHLAQMGLALANRLKSGDSGKLVINQLVGTASEAIVLRPWDANASYDWLGGKTPNYRMAELKQERTSFRFLTENLNEYMSDMTEAELLSYTDRKRLYGEIEAARWLQQRKNAAVTPP